MSARVSPKAALLGGVCLILASGLAARADDLESQLIALHLPQPVVAAAPAAAGKCVDPDAVLSQLEIEAVSLGGKAVALDGDVDQAFSNEWRRRIHVDPVPVSLILAHAFANPNDTEEFVVDTVEFDTHGCALSRTVLSLEAWSSLMKAAAGVPI